MATTAQVYQLYLAYFGRPPDFTGLNSFANSTPAQVQAIFSASAESRALLGSTDTATQVNNIYQNLFGRDAETAGLAYWVSEIASGRVTLASAAFDILNGARNADATVVANRIEVAQAFVANYSATTAGILGYVGDAAAAQARTFLRTVTDTAASKTAALAGVAAAVTSTVAAGGTTTPVVGSTFTLTTGVDAPSGGAGNDTISGLLGSSGTYTVGDNIAGGSGSDTLNLIAGSGDGDGGLVTISSVETINVRLLGTAGSAGNEVSLNAADWVGVTTITNASSLVNTQLEVSGLTDDTVVVLHGNTDISVGYNNTATGATANAVLVNAGSAGTATTIGSASATNTANFDFDEADAGLVTHVNLEVRGSLNLANIEAGSSVTNYTITGTGNAALITDDTITSFDASAAAGNIDITFSGASEVTAKGGAGNDTFRVGSTLSNNDSFNGGSGTDTVVATVAGFNRNLNTTNVESATLTFTEAAGGDVNASGSTVTSFTFAAGTAGNVASVSQIANAAVITLNDDSLGDVTLDYASGATTTTLNIGSASGTVGVGTLTITDVATVTINAVGVSGTVGGTITTASFDSDLKSLAITTSGGEADLTIGDTSVDMSLGGATSLTVTSNGSAGITFNNVDLAGSALTIVTVAANGTDAADIAIGDVSGSALTATNLTAASGADITVGTLNLGNVASAATQNEVLSISQGQNSDVTVGAITVTGQGTLTINLTQSATAIADLSTISLSKAGTADAVGQNLTFGAVTIAGSGVFGYDSIEMTIAGTGAQVTFGAVTVGQDGGYSAGNIQATGTTDVDVSSRTLTVGASATATFGNIAEMSGGAVGSVSVTLLSDATATFGTVTASAISTHTIVANTGASANFGAMTAEQTVGAIEISGVDGADVQFGTIGASAVGAISVSGALDVTFGTITATRIGEVNAQGLGASGAFTIDLSGVTNAVEAKLGVATNTVISGIGNDVITLTGGRTASAGNDNIRYTTATQGTDNIIGFIAGAAASGGDQIELVIASFASPLRDADGSAIDAASDTDTIVASSATTMAATDNILILTSAYASTAAMMTDLSSGITFATALQGSGTLVVVFTDGSDSFVSLVGFSASGNNTDVVLSSADDEMSITTLAVVQGVTPGALVAANFDFV